MVEMGIAQARISYYASIGCIRWLGRNRSSLLRDLENGDITEY
jgi:hypothetical protein